ncbi:hypothetical protein [Arsenicicoccus dermatophilus]|uniref:hypothetical protein n=1 Tax=Arsenicicoccus dermatophilus TaxID=1076331 RepID=UPI00391731B1
MDAATRHRGEQYRAGRPSLRVDLTAYAHEDGHITRIHGRDLRIPAQHAMLTTPTQATHARATFPDLLPTHLAIPTLSDYTPFLTPRQVRRTGALLAHMQATGDTLADTCTTLDVHPTAQRALRRAWWHLESRGQLADYLDDTAEVARRLLGATPAARQASDREVG